MAFASSCGSVYFAFASHADDLISPSILPIVDAKAPADRIFMGEKLPAEGLIDDSNERRMFVICFYSNRDLGSAFRLSRQENSS